MSAAKSASDRFYGGRVSGYEARRSGRPFWAKEHAAVRDMLTDLPRGSEVLDVPVGTGRYAPIYKEFGFHAWGVDLSRDMLREAKRAAEDIDYEISLWRGDILSLMWARDIFEVVVCTRLLNWLSSGDMAKAVSEIVRVSRNRIIVSIELNNRHRSNHDNQPHTEAAFIAAVAAAGGVIRNKVAIEPSYWMVRIGKLA